MKPFKRKDFMVQDKNLIASLKKNALTSINRESGPKGDKSEERMEKD